MFVSGSNLTVIEGRKETSPMMLDIAEPHCVDRVEWCCLVSSTQSWPSWLLSSAWQNAWRMCLPFTRTHARACTQRLHETDKKNKQKSSPEQRLAYFNISIWYQYFFVYRSDMLGSLLLNLQGQSNKVPPTYNSGKDVFLFQGLEYSPQPTIYANSYFIHLKAKSCCYNHAFITLVS